MNLNPSAAAMDLGLGAKATADAKEEAEQLQKKKKLDNKTGTSALVSPYQAAFMSLTGNQF